MSTLPSNDNAKQPPSVYTVMLVMSMLFMLIAVIAMFIEYSRWAPDHWRTISARPSAAVVTTVDHFA
ncbi:hypothetical protein [Rhodopirellula sp. MGV]|uniref:hypothetical protein n=1 Tax=Rhodopirellula sp. MGV TaxID=2023130 RepID=UPI000B96DFD9|nr:hypothetical protein [Rhodopirellula sp. MGV]OYP32169.1 hypothetical protein CGZ80_20450 [Rhodopirellula sp. MGV]PNY35177.1 hypothetical protein C2E31_19985 [Rhodopirellula baltica]